MTAAETRYYFHDPAGQPVWEYKVALGWETFNFYFNGKQVASNSAATTPALMWLHSDHLGSPRIKTDAAQVRLSYDTYLPYGEQINPPGDNIKYRFTGKERDGESGLDFFGARYLSGVQGRFMSPDPFNPVQDSENRSQFDEYLSAPQNWNRYAYVTNNPLKYVDPDGQNRLLVWLANPANQRLIERSLQQAYLRVTRLFNSPTGQEAIATVAELVTGSQLPSGFSNAAQFQQFGKAVSSGVREVAGEGAQAFLAGSAVTGKKFATGEAFDVGRKSDFDVALVGKGLLAKAKELGIELRGQGTRTGPLKSEALKALGLDKLARRLSRQTGRPVSFMIYKSEEELRRRGAPYQGLQ